MIMNKKYVKVMVDIDENGKKYAFDDPMTAKIRSKTFPGIAKAMADAVSL